MKRPLKFLSLAVFGWFVFWLLIGMAITSAHASGSLIGRVVAIADGDTLTVQVDGADRRIRLAEIDAPEKKQAFGEQSKQSLIVLCGNADALVTPSTVDRYGRTIGRVQCGGVDASFYQVSRGLAWAYTRYLTDPAIDTAERAARDERRGLWADSAPVPPWLYRKGDR